MQFKNFNSITYYDFQYTSNCSQNLQISMVMLQISKVEISVCSLYYNLQKQVYYHQFFVLNRNIKLEIKVLNWNYKSLEALQQLFSQRNFEKLYLKHVSVNRKIKIAYLILRINYLQNNFGTKGVSRLSPTFLCFNQ